MNTLQSSKVHMILVKFDLNLFNEGQEIEWLIKNVSESYEKLLDGVYHVKGECNCDTSPTLKTVCFDEGVEVVYRD